LKTRGRDAYEEDYEQGTQLKALADKYDVPILPLHHCRKMESADPVDMVSGTLGLTGSADGVLVLKRERGQHDAALFVTGRDIEEQELALRWDGEYALWSLVGQADEYRMSKERAEVLKVLKRENRAMTPKELAPLIGKTHNTTKQHLWQMEKDGWLTTQDGQYSVAHED
jgi:hypothetical protein